MRLLVVEDAPKMAALLQRAFREDGFAVDVQATGQEAVWMASECDFDAVILDVDFLTSTGSTSAASCGPGRGGCRFSC